jgi:hypothetical protein
MRSIFFILPATLIIQLAGAQNGPSALTVSQGTLASITVTPSAPASLTDAPSLPLAPEGDNVNIMDYKSVYEAATLEEEVQSAAERFKLTKSQQDVWTEAAFDRRQAEKIARERLDSKTTDYSKDAVYRGLRTAQNSFYEIITGYLSPAQKQAMEDDRTILHEKQRRLAKIAPPVVAPTVTVAPVDSTAIKEQILKEAEKIKAAEKKSKKKRKPKA